MPIRYTHLSKDNNLCINAKSPDSCPEFNSVYLLKPSGFWYAINDAWLRLHGGATIGQYEYCVDLGDTQVRRLSCEAEVRDFTEQFQKEDGIDWKEVASIYDGVELTTYDPAVASKFDWYDMWQCACGVIWQPRNLTLQALRKVDRIRVNEVIGSG